MQSLCGGDWGLWPGKSIETKPDSTLWFSIPLPDDILK